VKKRKWLTCRNSITFFFAIGLERPQSFPRPFYFSLTSSSPFAFIEKKFLQCQIFAFNVFCLPAIFCLPRCLFKGSLIHLNSLQSCIKDEQGCVWIYRRIYSVRKVFDLPFMNEDYQSILGLFTLRKV